LETGHRSLVIGGGGAIGCACVHTLAMAGAMVYSVDRSKEAANRALTCLDGEHQGFGCDVTDPVQVEQLAQTLKPVDSVIYAAGLNHDGEIITMDWSAYRQVMAVNLDGAFHVASSFTRSMIKAGKKGSFIFLSSTAGLRGEAGASLYCATKFGLIGLSESLAAELSTHSIRVNAVCPGNVDSPMLRDIAAKIAVRTGGRPNEVLENMAHGGAANRLVEAREVARLCLYLASPLSSAITGATIRIDAGGMLDL